MGKRACALPCTSPAMIATPQSFAICRSKDTGSLTRDVPLLDNELRMQRPCGIDAFQNVDHVLGLHAERIQTRDDL